MIARPPRAAGAAAKFASDGAGSVSQERLLVMLYERLQRDLQGAADAIRAGQREAAHFALLHAQEIVGELDGALNHDVWDGAGRLSDVYQYLITRMINANMAQDAAAVEDCLRVVTPLADMWSQAWTSVTSAKPAAPAAASLADVVPAPSTASPFGGAARAETATATLDVVG
jgi:flagellar protein FliS